MRYFIGYEFIGPAAGAIDRLRKEIADAFGVREALSFPPHVTLFYSFETEDIEVLKHTLERFVRTQSAFPLVLTEFGAFDPAVWFLDVEQSPELLDVKAGIARAVQETLGITENRNGKGTHFHCTLAYKDVTPDVFVQIGKFLDGRQIPVTDASLDAITLFRYDGQRWVSETAFAFGG